MNNSERVVDRVMRHIADAGVNHVFMVAGGGAMFINDAVDKSEEIDGVYLLHEQSCSFAAVGYGKTPERRFGVALGTSGCGSTNMMTGLLEAWQDGTPSLFISGNANYDQIHARDERHYGVQDLDLEPIVSPMTKAFFRVKNPEDIDQIMHLAFKIMLEGNPGPVWIDIPIDIQAQEVLTEYKQFDFSTSKRKVEIPTEVVDAIVNAERPLILVGAGYQGQFDADRVCIPVISTFGATHKVINSYGFIGAIGLKGNRLANMALYYADTVVVFGSSLSVPATGYDLKDSFGHCKNLIIIDKEVNKFKKRVYSSDIENIYFINADAADAYNELWTQIKEAKSTYVPRLYSLGLEEKEDHDDTDRFNIKQICDEILHKIPYARIVSDTGSAYYVISKLRYITDHITSTAQLAMGGALPYAIGVYYATGDEVYTFTGDGSFQMNAQDLGALRGTKIKLFVLNNEGYLSIRSSQDKFISGKNYGTDTGVDLRMPDLKTFCDAYEISHSRHYKAIEPKGTLPQTDPKRDYSAQVNEIMCNPDEDIYPRVEAAKNPDGSFTSFGFKNMYPFLTEEEILEIENILEVN